MSEVLANMPTSSGSGQWWLILDCGHWYKWDGPHPFTGKEFDCAECKPPIEVVSADSPEAARPAQGTTLPQRCLAADGIFNQCDLLIGHAGPHEARRGAFFTQWAGSKYTPEPVPWSPPSTTATPALTRETLDRRTAEACARVVESAASEDASADHVAACLRQFLRDHVSMGDLPPVLTRESLEQAVRELENWLRTQLCDAREKAAEASVRAKSGAPLAYAAEAVRELNVGRASMAVEALNEIERLLPVLAPVVAAPAGQTPTPETIERLEGVCPVTGQAQCARCSGYWCESHRRRNCRCDWWQRHGKTKPEQTAPAPSSGAHER